MKRTLEVKWDDPVRLAQAGRSMPGIGFLRAIRDGQMMSLRNTESIHGFYSGARRIGHFGFFRSAFESSLWRQHLLPELA